MTGLTQRQSGFTLVELMIVFLILGILIGIAVPVMLNSRKSARQRVCQANQRVVDGAVQAYSALKEGEYPDELDDLMQSGTELLKKIPHCPNGSTGYEWVPKVPEDPPYTSSPYISCPYQADHKL